MKIFFICLLLLEIVTTANAINIEKIVQKIDKIITTQIKATLDYKVYDPFAKAKPLIKQKKIQQRTTKAKPIKIQTILNNCVLISGKWYNKGDRIHGCIIKSVNSHNIVVVKNHKRTTVYTEKKRNFIHMKEIIK